MRNCMHIGALPKIFSLLLLLSIFQYLFYNGYFIIELHHNYNFFMFRNWKKPCSRTLLSIAHVSDDYAELERLRKNYGVIKRTINIDCSLGGEWSPKHCRPQIAVAVIIPFRDRQHHLKFFLSIIHPHLQKQHLHYRIFVLHQISTNKFNRGTLMNVGFMEALKIADFECFIFHDVDLLPVKPIIPYNCSTRGPLHMVAAMDKYRWNLPYGAYFGGVCAFLKQQYMEMNGFSNLYWGWGGEDDDARARLFVNVEV